MFRVRYIYSACIVIETDDLKILCDPWFTPGAYDGAWYPFPVVSDPIRTLGKCDYIYISHIHPDHYDPVFLKKYLELYPDVKIIIADFKNNFLSKKMTQNQIPHSVVSSLKLGETELKIFPNESSSYDVDSALVILSQGKSLLNLNDNLYHEQQLDQILSYCQHKIDLACMTYTGAGPYPQTYYGDELTLKQKAAAKKSEFFSRYMKLKAKLSPHFILPFAGKYLLGGRLAQLNPYRGVADAVEVASICEQAIVLDDGGDAYFDLLSS